MVMDSVVSGGNCTSAPGLLGVLAERLWSPYASRPKYQNIKIKRNIVTNSVKALKIVPHQKNLFKKLK